VSHVAVHLSVLDWSVVVVVVSPARCRICFSGGKQHPASLGVITNVSSMQRVPRGCPSLVCCCCCCCNSCCYSSPLSCVSEVGSSTLHSLGVITNVSSMQCVPHGCPSLVCCCCCCCNSCCYSSPLSCVSEAEAALCTLWESSLMSHPCSVSHCIGLVCCS